MFPLKKRIKLKSLSSSSYLFCYNSAIYKFIWLSEITLFTEYLIIEKSKLKTTDIQKLHSKVNQIVTNK
jgi:hypothetical protein